MQLSNGLTNPAGLWLGHLLFDGISCTIMATIVVVVFTVASDQFHGLGYFVSLYNSFTTKPRNNDYLFHAVGRACAIWIGRCAFFVLRFPFRCISSRGVRRCCGLSSCHVHCAYYCSREFSYFIEGSSLHFQLYLAGYLLTITYAKNSKAAGIITTISLSLIISSSLRLLIFFVDFTVSICSPVASVVCFDSVSVF